MITLPLSSSPPTTSIQFMNSPVLPEINARQSRRRLPFQLSATWLPPKISWIRALCLLPLVLPGMRVVSSGFSWFNWLNFPFSWLVATMMFVMMHLAIPMLILAGLYNLVMSRFSNFRSSTYRTVWFAISTIVIILLSFASTVGINNMLETSLCQVLSMWSDACNSRFAPTSIQDLAVSIDSYNFQFYTWVLWLTITAYLYHLENKLQDRYLPQLKNTLENYQDSEAVGMVSPINTFNGEDTFSCQDTFSGEDTINQEYLNETA